jgi:hypothetical protein
MLIYELDIKEERPKLKSPKELTIVECSAITASRFNALYHSRLPRIPPSNITRNKHYVCYRAYKGIINYAVAIWSTPVAANRFKDGDKLLELRRFAISPEASHNTASWMLSRMVKAIKNKFPDIIRLISYQDTEVHLGTIYKASNWYIEERCKYNSWNNRKRNRAQSEADKIRWAYNLNGGINADIRNPIE